MSMSVEQALKDAEWLAKAAYDAGVHELGYDPIAVLRAHIKREVVVTDEMRDAALKSWMGDSIIVPFAGESRMKAALIAALEGE